MNIAFISYEYPPDTADGGIATYVRQAAAMLARAGQHVEVFAASRTRTETSAEDGVLVHRLLTQLHSTFPVLAAAAFIRRHSESRFDVIEGPEYGAEAREIRRLAPQVPLLIKLHTPNYLVTQLEAAPRRDYLQMFREYAGALRRGRRPWWHYDFRSDIERIHAADADEIVAPSEAIKRRVLADWRLASERISCFPLPYTPSPELLKIPVGSSTNTVTFLGRLERRKGIFDLATAIPLVLKHRPEIRFRLVGKCASGIVEQLHKLLGTSIKSVDLAGQVRLDEIPAVLAESDLCVFPSLWENFGLVCLEAMSAARAIVASEAGGMSELLDYGAVGRLVPPHRPRRLAAQILALLNNPELRMQLGRAARQRILDRYSEQRICPEQIASYSRAIENCKSSFEQTKIPAKSEAAQIRLRANSRPTFSAAE